MISWRDTFFLWSFEINSYPWLFFVRRLLYPGRDKSRRLLLDRWKYLLQWNWISLKESEISHLNRRRRYFFIFFICNVFSCNIIIISPKFSKKVKCAYLCLPINTFQTLTFPLTTTPSLSQLFPSFPSAKLRHQKNCPMDLHQRRIKPLNPNIVSDKPDNKDLSIKHPLLLYLTNYLFFIMFFSVIYVLLDGQHSLIASFTYLLGFFGVEHVQCIISNKAKKCCSAKDKVCQRNL